MTRSHSNPFVASSAVFPARIEPLRTPRYAASLDTPLRRYSGRTGHSRRLALALILLGATTAAQAHTRGTSYSYWEIGQDRAEVRVHVSQLELTRLQLDPSLTPDYLRQAGARVQRQVQLRSGAERCSARDVTAEFAENGWLNARWALQCPRWDDLSVQSTLLTAVAPSHLHFVRVQFADGAVVERVLTASDSVLPLPQAQQVSVSSSLGRYIALGIEHILSGWDHLAFVLALILLAASLPEIALIATGFTVAHSLTLAAAVLGLVQTDAPLVEAVIGFSIALAAIENLWRRAGRARWAPMALTAALLILALTSASRLPGTLLLGLALFTGCYFALMSRTGRPARLRIAMGFIFGLVHGFGFAGALSALRLPAEQLAVGLLGFNLGVELGQLLVIALVWPVLKLLARWPAPRFWLNDSAASVICGLGVYWFVLRSFA
jgi:hypothetical protein